MAARLFNKAGWIAAGVLALLLVAALGGVVFGGPLDPPASPGATQPQVEPRNPIPPVGWDGSFPINIAQPGSYFLTRDLIGVASKHGIYIDSDSVTLDLNGFTLNGAIGSYNGIVVFGTHSNVVIRNGIVRSWGQLGINAAYAVGSTFEDLHVDQNGAGLSIGSGDTVSRVSARFNSDVGIRIAQVNDNWGGSVDHSNFSRNATFGVYISANDIMVRDSVIDSNGSDGVYLAGSWNDVQDSRMVGNGGGSGGFGVNMPGTLNLVAHNLISGNVSGATTAPGSANRIGPGVIDAALTTSDPWSNVEY